MESIRYAVVGLNHGKGHITTILSNPRRKVVALCDKDRGMLEDSVRLTREKNASVNEVMQFLSIDELLNWGRFDAIVIAVPPKIHSELAVKALNAGKHVLLEKPLTNTLEESEELRKVCDKTKTVFQVGYEVRSSQLVSKTIEVINSGKIGEVVFVWWNMFLDYASHERPHWQTVRELGGGKLQDCCPHYIDIMSMFAGARFYRITAYGTAKGKKGPNPKDMPEVAAVIFEYENGVKGNLNLSQITPAYPNSLFGVAGTKGIIYGDPWLPEGAGSLDCYTEGCLYRERITISGTMASRGHLGFAEQHDAFMNSILKGTKIVCTFDDAYEVLLMSKAIDRSVSTGETIFRSELFKEVFRKEPEKTRKK
jgi:predicted dehydrogenase